MSGSNTYTLSMTAAGAQPQTPAALNALLIATALGLMPGLTANLPGSLIEDIASTDTAALLICDAAAVDLVNSVSPFTANQFILYQLGQVYGVQPGADTNTSVYVVFSGTAGQVVPIGFIVSDGAYQYYVVDGGIIGTGGTSLPLYCLATVGGTWAVPANTVTAFVTSISGLALTSCTNPLPGTPGGAAQTIEDYRSQVLTAGLASATGMPRTLRTALAAVIGVQPRLVSIQQASGGGFKVIVGGGDPYQVGYAIWSALADISTLVGSTTTARNITATISDPPDSYSIIFVNPPAQVVTVSITWNTPSGTFYANPAAVQQLGAAAIANYVNSITVGQPINVLDMQSVFQQAVVSLIPTNLLTRLLFSVFVNGTLQAPISGTQEIPGDTESYFTATQAGITITQG